MGGFVALGLGWLATLGMARLARVGTFRAPRMAFLALPFALAALPLVVTRTGEPLGTLELGPIALAISGQGLREFATILLKSWISVQAALLLAFTTPFHDLVDGLRQLRLPWLMVAIVGFMDRYLGVLTGEAGRMTRARAARSAAPGGRGGGSIRWRAAVTGHLVGTLFLRSYERSERIYLAMQARGFEGRRPAAGGPAFGPRRLAWLGLGLALLAGFEVAAHAWLPR